ncbi:MAG TPA: PAS domain S-box protein [Methanospirillum sp.]|uniref:PAS domain S-box protein n=1 Tax=Methanospirillum sp. TaxID=45200 RepID=UPI002D079155|nr:PAS domain S-box protein [Methanospirillum sp.]HWQ64604.1 PAS domain S-box protein [Methanospirillum sp.]
MKTHVWMTILLLIVSSAYVASGEPVQTTVNTSLSSLLFLGNENIPPVIFLDGTTPKGVDVDIVRALAPHISQPIEIKAMNWSQAQSLVAQGKADALIQINPTEERLKFYDFSDTLLESQFSIFTREEKLGISGISSLRGLKVGVEAKGLPLQILEKDPEILLTIIPNFTEGFNQVQSGSLDAVVVDYRVGSYILAQNRIQNIKVSGEPIASSNSSFAVKKGNTKLLNEINNALQIIKADGTYRSVLDAWNPTEGIFQTREQITEGTYRVAIIFLLLLFVIGGIWIATIQRELTRRKSAENKLMEQYSILHGIINSANALIFSVDRTYRYTSFNQGHATTMKNLYGAEIELGQSILDYISVPLDRETSRHNLDLALTGEELVDEAYSGEELLSRKYFYVLHNPIRSREEIIGVAVLAHDITDRKLAEVNLHQVLETLEQQVHERTDQLSEANQELITQIAEREQGEHDLRESEERYHAIYDQSPIAIELFDASGTLVQMNPACMTLFGIDDIKKIQTFSLFSDIYLTDKRKNKLYLGEGIQYHGSFDFDKVKNRYGYPTTREGIIWIDIVITPLCNDGETITGYLVQIQDITKRKEAEEAMRIAEETYRTIFLNSQIGLFRTDIITRFIIDANDAVARFFGFEGRESLLENPFSMAERYVEPHDREKMISLLKETCEFQNYEMRIRQNDDSIVWIRFSARLIWEKGWIEGVAEDITDYKLATEALADSESRLQLALSGSETGMWEIHIPSMMGNFDNQAAGLIGYEQNENGFYTLKIGELSYPEDIPLIMQRLNNYLGGLTTIFESEHRIRKTSGEWIWVLVRGKTTQWLDDGSPLLISGTIQDISERKQIQDNLRESEKRYRDMFEINNAVMLIIDSETNRIVDANAAAIKYYEYDRDELINKSISEINTADPEVIKMDISYAVGQKGTIFQFKHRKKSGEIRDVEVFSGPVIAKGKRLLHSIIQDVTERNRVEEALRQANHKLNLLSSITRHDIGNELQVIFGYLEFAHETDLSPEVRKYIEKANISSHNIERQLAFTRDYEDIGVHTPVWQDVGLVISHVMKPVDIGSIQLQIDISGVEVFADPLMEKVFYNLVENARRYGETITKIRFSGNEQEGGYIIICADDGVGIPDEFKGKIFKREYYKHTGFGLNLSREILDITGISITETGEPGKGARFEIMVPKGKWRLTGVK